MKHYIGLVIGISCFIGCFNSSAACLDGHPVPAVEVKDSFATGIGIPESMVKVVDENGDLTATVYLVKMEKTLKGKVGKYVQLLSENTSSRFEMNIGTPYLLFIAQGKETLFINACGNSGPLSAKANIISQIR